MTTVDLILASSSPYRRNLLRRLGLSFRCIAPDIDETPRAGERPAELAARLALAKAGAVAHGNPGALVIGSDQVALLGETILAKPGTLANAQAQLRLCSGREVVFLTGVSLVCQQQQIRRVHVEPFAVRFRELDDAMIDRYLARDQPLDCAGSLKVESLGIALLARLAGDDPTSLEGLPLIGLTSLLNECGVPPI